MELWLLGGDNYYGQTNVPAGWSNVVAIASCSGYTLALKRDGTVLAREHQYSSGGYGTAPSGLASVVAISAGANALALVSDDTSPVPISPVNLAAVYGLPLILPASVSATVGQKHQWAFNGVDMFAETNLAFTLNRTEFTNAGTYSVVVSNIAGIATNSYVLNVIPFEMVASPKGITNYAGTTVTFSVTVSGMDLAYQWQFNQTNLLGATTGQLVLTNIALEQAGLTGL